MVDVPGACRWQESHRGVVCAVCGTRRPFARLRRCGASSSVQSDNGCPHLGERLADDDGKGAVELVPCTGCGSRDGKREAAVFACTIYDECLPTYRPSAEQRAEYEQRPDAVRLCDGCPRQLS